MEKSEYPACLQEGYDLNVPEAAFNKYDSVWSTASYADNLLKSAVQVAAKNLAKSDDIDPEDVKDLALMKAARKVLRPVHREENDSSASSTSSDSENDSNDEAPNDKTLNDKTRDDEAPNDETSAADSSDEDDNAKRNTDHGSEPKSKSISPGAGSPARSTTASKGREPKMSRSRTPTIKTEGEASKPFPNTSKKRKKTVSVEYNRDPKRPKGVPALRETITTTTIREKY
ncbi:hypothetical protein MMC34_003482 [Xylographa carneopallida]|nr:hypothetical protein [Xylographa carneopallida]